MRHVVAWPGWLWAAWLAFGAVDSAAAAASAAVPATRQVAITVDDLPWVEFARSTDAEADARQQRMVEALRRFDTHAIGFVNEDKLERDGRVEPARVALLERWLDAGLDLGNHSYDHNGLHATAITDYERSILRGEAQTRKLLEARGKALRWFRHPYLHAGRDDAVRLRLAEFLETRGYRVAPVTIDNGDWIYARAYVEALNANDAALARRLRADFVAYMIAKFAFYETASRRLFGREIPQVLLLHANAINADTLPELLRAIRGRGYAFVPLETAVADIAYAHADGYRGGAGISWLHRWALTEKMPKDFYAGEPMVPPYVLALAGVDGE